MKKLLLIIYLLSITAHAEEIKLQCNVTSKYTESSGKSKRESGTAIIDIDTSSPLYFEVSSSIAVFNDVSILVRNKDDNEWKISIVNNSNSSKWDISHDVNVKVKNTYARERIIIDRNTGNVIYRKSFTSSSNQTNTTEVTGTCSKVDTTKRKF